MILTLTPKNELLDKRSSVETLRIHLKMVKIIKNDWFFAMMQSNESVCGDENFANCDNVVPSLFLPFIFVFEEGMILEQSIATKYKNSYFS